MDFFDIVITLKIIDGKKKRYFDFHENRTSGFFSRPFEIVDVNRVGKRRLIEVMESLMLN